MNHKFKRVIVCKEKHAVGVEDLQGSLMLSPSVPFLAEPHCFPSSGPALHYGHEPVSGLFLIIQLFGRKSDLKRVENDSELEKTRTLDYKQKKES